MWRGKTGPVHSATVVPKAAMGLRYGKFEERFRVSHVATGYKSAHLLWPVDNASCPNCEIDFPELEWTGRIAAFMHHKNSVGGDQDAYDTRTDLDRLAYEQRDLDSGQRHLALDGKIVGHSTTAVPNTPMSWDIQNESALNGESSPQLVGPDGYRLRPRVVLLLTPRFEPSRLGATRWGCPPRGWRAVSRARYAPRCRAREDRLVAAAVGRPYPRFQRCGAAWSARWAHNPEVIGSNPIGATKGKVAGSNPVQPRKRPCTAWPVAQLGRRPRVIAG